MTVPKKKRMDTLEIVAHHKDLHDNWMWYLVRAIPFKDEQKNEDLEIAKKMLAEFEERKWECST